MARKKNSFEKWFLDIGASTQELENLVKGLSSIGLEVRELVPRSQIYEVNDYINKISGTVRITSGLPYNHIATEPRFYSVIKREIKKKGWTCKTRRVRGNYSEIAQIKV